MQSVATAVCRLVRSTVGRGVNSWGRRQILNRTGMSESEYEAAIDWCAKKQLIGFHGGRYETRYYFADSVVEAWQSALEEFRASRDTKLRSLGVTPRFARSNEVLATLEPRSLPNKKQNLVTSIGAERARAFGESTKGASETHENFDRESTHSAGVENLEEHRPTTAGKKQHQVGGKTSGKNGSRNHDVDAHGDDHDVRPRSMERHHPRAGEHGVRNSSSKKLRRATIFPVKPFSDEIQDWSSHIPNEVIFQALNRTTNRATVLNIAKEIHRLYGLGMEARKSQWSPIQIPSWRNVPEGDDKFFLKAAKMCSTLKVSPSTFVQAQFWWFERFGRSKRGRVMLPQLNHLVGESAFSRVTDYEDYLEASKYRKERPKEERYQSTRKREMRKLRQLVDLLKMTNREVLLSVPTEFSKEFLEGQGVWSEVADTWRQSE